MKSIMKSALLVIVAVGWVPASHADQEQTPGTHGVPCQSSALDLYQACHSDIRAELKATEASCEHISNAADRGACEADARASYREGGPACLSQVRARFDVCSVLNEYRYEDPLADWRINYINPNDVPDIYSPNPYVSVAAGRTLLLRGGEDFEERIVIHASPEIRDVHGVPCRVVWDVVLLAEENDEGEIEYAPVELTQDWFAQSDTGDVYYCGEAVQDFEDGLVVSLDGSFEAGTDYARGGILVQANPVIGLTHRQEMAAGEAEDLVRYVDIVAVPTQAEGGDNPSVPCAPVGCLRTFDFSPLAPAGTEYKYYRAGVGFVLALALEDGELTGEREELVCAGDSLAVLGEDQCQLEDPAALREAICKLVPDALCEGE